jgi:flavin-binding protein dodecin
MATVKIIELVDNAITEYRATVKVAFLVETQ